LKRPTRKKFQVERKNFKTKKGKTEEGVGGDCKPPRYSRKKKKDVEEETEVKYQDQRKLRNE